MTQQSQYETMLTSRFAAEYGMTSPPLASPAERTRLIRILREFLQTEMDHLHQKHRHGSGGQEVVSARTALVDSLVCFTYRLFSEHYQTGDLLTLVATGGYGRGELNPKSDIDILFLYAEKLDNPTSDMIREMLQLLWDLKLDLGWSNRSLIECIQWGNTDLTVKTSLIESRYLIGNKTLYERFTQIVRAYLLGADVDDYIRQKWEERRQRHASYAGVHTLLEPNVKESPGGLRDHHLVLWTGIVKFGITSVSQLVEKGLAHREQINRLERAYDFLLRIRNDLHFAMGRKNDVLSIASHAEVARRLGYSPEGEFLPGERFMRDYYLAANEIVQFSSMILQKCLPEKTKRVKMVSDHTIQTIQNAIDDGVVLSADGIHLQGDNADLLCQNPALFLKLFLYQQHLSLGFSEPLKELIRSHLFYIDEKFRHQKSHSDLFLAILRGEQAANTLRSMHELGVLGAYLPELAHLTCLIQYDFYHKYTVDEHTLRSIEYLEDLTEPPARELKELGRIYRQLSHPEVVKLALLLHDTGKGKGGEHVEKSIELVQQVVKRLQLSEKFCDQVTVLVKYHLLMNHIAQRRDIHDPKTITEFAETIKNLENLDMLYLLTYADIKAVGPDVWTIWKGALLGELYLLTRRYFSPEEEMVLTGEALLEQLRREVSRDLEGRVDPQTIATHFAFMPYKYFVSTPPNRIAQHILLLQKIDEHPLAVKHIPNVEIGHSELMVCMPDKPGNFSKLAGVLASHFLNILGAQIYTRSDGIAIDTLQVESLDKKPILDENLWQELTNDLHAILITGTKRMNDLSLPLGQTIFSQKERALQTATMVKIDNRISDTHTVIEVTTYDRLGLLYLITDCLFKLDIDIYLAKISTEGNRVMDAFYVTDVAGNKLLDPERVAQVKKRLEQALL